MRNGYTYIPSVEGQDFFVSHRMMVDGIEDQLGPTEGFIPRDINFYEVGGVMKVFTFAKNANPEMKVQVVAAAYCMMEIIFQFHSSKCRSSSTFSRSPTTFPSSMRYERHYIHERIFAIPSSHF